MRQPPVDVTERASAMLTLALVSRLQARAIGHSNRAYDVLGRHTSLLRAFILPLLVHRFPLSGATHSLNDFLGAHPLLDLRL